MARGELITKTFDIEHGAVPLPPGREVWPFAAFPLEQRLRIAAAVTLPTPPPYWLRLGPALIPSREWYEWHWHRGIDPEKQRPKLPAGLRALVIERDGLVCGICGGAVAPDDVHIDHIVPWSRGGAETLSNLQVAHSLCNMRKGARV